MITLPVILKAFSYVTTDDWFWVSMAFTTIIGLFIGSVIYNGDLKEIKKGLVSLAAYGMMIIFTTTTRSLPKVTEVTPGREYMYFVGTATVLVVTFFYLFGMQLGVIITRLAHKGVKK